MSNIFRNIFRSKDSDIPHSPTFPLEDIPRNILAFRTISKLLSQIQQEHLFQDTHPKELLPVERLELKLSNAFSTLAVIEHEVVAVVTKRTEEVLEVTACPQTLTNQDPATSSGIFAPFWHLLFAQNYRRSSSQLAILSTGEPTISDAMTLASMDSIDGEALILEAECHR